MVFPAITDLAGMMQTGLFERAGWLFTGLGNAASRMQFLQMVYPNVPIGDISRGLSLAQQSWQIGQQVEAGYALPDVSEVPSRTGSEGDTGYDVSAVIKGPDPNNPARTIAIPLVLSIPPGVNTDDFLEAVNFAAQEQLEEGAPQCPPPCPDVSEIDISEGVYAIIITSVTRN